MWCELKTRISSANIDALLQRAKSHLSTTDSTEVVSSGKDFFGGDDAENNNFDLLQSFHREIWPELAHRTGFEQPVVDHCYLLVKNPGGEFTRLHQDRPYWVRKDPEPSILSVWIALDDISEHNGGLILSDENKVGIDELPSFNSGPMLEHLPSNAESASFTLLIPEDTAAEMAKSMQPVTMAKGDAIVFDSFEPHMSSANNSDKPRLGMKIAYGEGTGRQYYMMSVDELESS